MRFCQRGVLQFIIIQPSVAVISLILLLCGYYYSPEWQIIETIIYNISYIWALYCLYVFYLAVKQNIKSFRPIAKFATVKTIIFATYYQSLFLKLTLIDSNQAIMWNDLLLCLEMVIFSIALMFAFPVSDFQGGIPDRRVLVNAKDIFTIKDILHDIYYNFNPGYEDYALQRSQGEMPTNTINLMKRHTTTNSNNLTTLQQVSDPSDIYTNTTTNTLLESGQLNGKLNPVAYEMTERYRGRSKRMAFNSLLRGTQPIRAKLRSSREFSSIEMDDIENNSSSGSSKVIVVEEENALLGDSGSSTVEVHSVLHHHPTVTTTSNTTTSTTGTITTPIHYSEYNNEIEETKGSLEDTVEVVFHTHAPSHSINTTNSAHSSGTNDSISHLGRLQIGRKLTSSRRSPTGPSDELKSSRRSPTGPSDELKSSRRSPTGRSDELKSSRRSPTGSSDELKSSRRSPTGPCDSRRSPTSPGRLESEEQSYSNNSISNSHSNNSINNNHSNSYNKIGKVGSFSSVESQEKGCSELALVGSNHSTSTPILETNRSELALVGSNHSSNTPILETNSSTTTTHEVPSTSSSTTTNTTTSSTNNTTNNNEFIQQQHKQSHTHQQLLLEQSIHLDDQHQHSSQHQHNSNEIELNMIVSKSHQQEQNDEEPCTDAEEWGDFS